MTDHIEIYTSSFNDFSIMYAEYSAYISTILELIELFLSFGDVKNTRYSIKEKKGKNIVGTR